MSKSHFTNLEIPEQILRNWQDIVNIIADLINVPAGLIMRIVDKDIEVFVSSSTKSNPYTVGESKHLAGSGLYCEWVIRNKKKLLIPNALKDKKWKDNPDIEINMISYLGFPIILPDGTPFGTICILDSKENKYSKLYEQTILKFREIIHSHLELICANQSLGGKNKTLSDHVEEIKTLREFIPICAWCKKVKDDEGYWQAIESYVQKHSESMFTHGICNECAKKLSVNSNS